MVNLVRGKSAVDIQPRQSVRFVVTVIDVEDDVPVGIDTASNGPCTGTTTAATNTANEQPRHGVVVDEFSQALCCNLDGSQ
jgi:hypothetical protein